MISNLDQVAVRRAAALSHFVPNFGFRIRRQHSVLAEIGRNISPTSHRVVGPCEFRWALASTLSASPFSPEAYHLDYLSHPSPTSHPLTVDWTMAFPGRLHSSGLIEASLPSGHTRWVFATLVTLDTLSAIVSQLGLDQPIPNQQSCVRVDGFSDEKMGISLVVVDVLDHLDANACRETAEAVLGEAMAHELLQPSTER